MREKKKILIVDDNYDVIATYKVVLDRMGYGVEIARDGNECLDKIEQEKPDMVLLDVLLPGLSGSEVCRRIKDTVHTKDVPVVAITASLAAATREKMSQVGADEFLLKPIDVSDLNRVIKKFLGV
ncbi:MAG TPA: response regulator [Candidatus Anoxymicrobiaceae bacterium]|jgi:CheY-like chemotaxis protein